MTLYGAIARAANNAAFEEAASIADAEAEKLDALAAEMRQRIAIAPRRGLKYHRDTYEGAAKAARRIAAAIRAKITPEEEG
jgi:putative salt-induced outer membrane protein YdiY